MRLLQGIALIACLGIAQAFGAASSLAAERLALVIGNSEYSGGAMTPLKNPVNDAALIADTLRQAGFSVETVLDADLRTMKQAVRAFTQRLGEAGEGSVAAVYYSGHGFQAGGRNYLAPIGADLRDEVDAEFEALAVDWVLSAVEDAHKGANIVILDACRNTALSRSVGAGGLALLNSTPRGSFISFATAPGSTAADGTGLNSPYTSAIAAELLVPGRSIEAVFKAVRLRVVEATGGDQVPWDHSSLTSEIVFVPDASADGSAAVARAAPGSDVQLELQLWNDVKDSGSADQIRSYLDRFPDGAFAALAKARLDEVGEGSGNDKIGQLFAQLASRSLIVDNPTQPHEFYSNARLKEIRGDYPGARQDYLKYFAFGMPQVDPHLRFQSVLRVQEGRAGALEIYRSLSQGRNDPTTLFAEILLEERDERVRRLGAFLDAYPDFSPALYALSQDYSQTRLGQQSATDKTRERDLLDRFMAAVEDGRFLGYYLDQQMAAEQVEDARTRLAALSFINPAALANPVAPQRHAVEPGVDADPRHRRPDARDLREAAGRRSPLHRLRQRRGRPIDRRADPLSGLRASRQCRRHRHRGELSQHPWRDAGPLLRQLQPRRRTDLRPEGHPGAPEHRMARLPGLGRPQAALFHPSDQLSLRDPGSALRPRQRNAGPGFRHRSLRSGQPACGSPVRARLDDPCRHSRRHILRHGGTALSRRHEVGREALRRRPMTRATILGPCGPGRGRGW